MRVDVANPNPGPIGGHNTGGADNKYVSQCSVCQCGVYKTQRWVWLNGFTGPVGIVHEPCATSHTKAVTNHGP